MSCYFIDVKGFLRNFIEIAIKELCIIDVNNIFKPFHQVYTGNIDWQCLTFDVQLINEEITRRKLLLSWDEGLDYFCPPCIAHMFDDTKIFYVVEDEDDKKIQLLKIHFPTWRFINYKLKQRTKVPINISCPWREHGENCAYKICLLGVIDYIKINEW